jgi:hypothetical protein
MSMVRYFPVRGAEGNWHTLRSRVNGRFSKSPYAKAKQDVQDRLRRQDHLLWQYKDRITQLMLICIMFVYANKLKS